MAQKPKQPLQQTAIGYIPPHYVEKSQSLHSNFCRFLSVLLDSYYGSKAKEVLERLMEDYRLGATRDGAVIFWQIDRENKVRTGKVMQYNPGDGHRVKDGQHTEKATGTGGGMAAFPMPFRGTPVECLS